MARTTALLVLAGVAGTSAFAVVGSATRQPRMAAVARPAVALQTAMPSAAIAAEIRSPAPMMNGAFKETSVRSAVKAIGWRITAGIVTAITSYIFTKSLAAAAAIVGWDLCSKSVTMFIGERIWNKFDWGKEEGEGGTDGGDSAKRSLAKAIAWRIFAATNTFVGATLLNKGKAGVAGKIAGSDSVVKTVLFFFYERVWAKIAWGKVAADA